MSTLNSWRENFSCCVVSLSVKQDVTSVSFLCMWAKVRRLRVQAGLRRPSRSLVVQDLTGGLMNLSPGETGHVWPQEMFQKALKQLRGLPALCAAVRIQISFHIYDTETTVKLQKLVKQQLCIFQTSRQQDVLALSVSTNHRYVTFIRVSKLT